MICASAGGSGAIQEVWPPLRAPADLAPHCCLFTHAGQWEVSSHQGGAHDGRHDTSEDEQGLKSCCWLLLSIDVNWWWFHVARTLARTLTRHTLVQGTDFGKSGLLRI
ncbi:chaperonin CPN60-2, mitochondrial-like [Iris pallida]|uniref:Chaperonin CPN60-2, mitochondrial-like n=1 Tax=Iris pallida TaxID=29817 RepID=A0AAX6F7W6_IRIPA|nr:chaperonin CPN60-2, mitochondrial-like [Iris pallida]